MNFAVSSQLVDRLAFACHGGLCGVGQACCVLPELHRESPLCMVQSPRFAAFPASVQRLHQLTLGRVGDASVDVQSPLALRMSVVRRSC